MRTRVWSMLALAGAAMAFGARPSAADQAQLLQIYNAIKARESQFPLHGFAVGSVAASQALQGIEDGTWSLMLPRYAVLPGGGSFEVHLGCPLRMEHDAEPKAAIPTERAP